MQQNIAIRWTVGDVSGYGFEALRLSVHCAVRLFGAEAEYVVCVNSTSMEQAKRRTGSVPDCVVWRDNSDDIPGILADSMDGNKSEGTGWKLAPLRLFPDAYEISLDNDVILWNLPESMVDWLGQQRQCLIAEDVERCLGQFDAYCPPGTYNSGIRGLPPAYDPAPAIADILQRYEKDMGKPALLYSELDEQGLQTAALATNNCLSVIRKEEVTICSPFWPRTVEPGSCGAHFVGLNAHHLPWSYYCSPADIWRRRHWESMRGKLYRIAGIEPQNKS